MSLDGPTMAAIALNTVQNTGGRTVTFTTLASDYDVLTGINTRTPTSYSVSSSPLIPGSGGRALSDGATSASVAGTLYVPASGLPFTPTEGMQVAIDGAQFMVTGVETFPVATTNVLYVVTVKRGGVEPTTE